MTSLTDLPYKGHINTTIHGNACIYWNTTKYPKEELCDPFLFDLLIDGYQVEFIHGLLQSRQTNLVQSFNCSFRYVNDMYILCKLT